MKNKWKFGSDIDDTFVFPAVGLPHYQPRFLGRNVLMCAGQWTCSNLIHFEHFVLATHILCRKPWDSEFTEINYIVARTLCVSLWKWAAFVAIWTSCPETPERWSESSSFEEEKTIHKTIFRVLLETESAAKN